MQFTPQNLQFTNLLGSSRTRTKYLRLLNGLFESWLGYVFFFARGWGRSTQQKEIYWHPIGFVEQLKVDHHGPAGRATVCGVKLAKQCRPLCFWIARCIWQRRCQIFSPKARVLDSFGGYELLLWFRGTVETQQVVPIGHYRFGLD